MYQRSQADVEKYLGNWQACFQAVEIHEPESVIPFLHEMEKGRLHVALADLTKGDHTAALSLLRDNLRYQQLRLDGWLPSKMDLDQEIDIDSFNPKEYRNHYILLCQLICVFQPRIFPRTRQDVWRFLQGSLGWVDQFRKLGAKEGDISRFQTQMAFTVVEFENGNNEAAIAWLEASQRPLEGRGMFAGCCWC